MWFSKHHYANELAKLGNQVYYLDPVGKWQFNNLWDRKIQAKVVLKNVTVLNYKNPLPVRLFPRLATFLNDFIVSQSIKQFLKNEAFVLWQFDFLRLVIFPNREVKRIYHVADPYMHAWSDPVIAKKADLILCTSPKYLLHYQTLSAREKVIQVPHGISESELLPDPTLVESIREKYGEFALLVGSINDDLDLDLLETIASKTRLLILGKLSLSDPGNSRKWKAITSLATVQYLGVVHAEKLKNFISASKVCLLTYRFDLAKTIGSGSPLKVLNYLAQGKPVITSIDPEIPLLENKAIFWAQNQESYLNFLNKALAGNLRVDNEKVDEYLDHHMYPKMIENIFSLV